MTTPFGVWDVILLTSPYLIVFGVLFNSDRIIKAWERRYGPYEEKYDERARKRLQRKN